MHPPPHGGVALGRVLPYDQGAMFFLKLCFLPMMLKVLSKTQRPFLCATFYFLCMLTNGLMFDLAFGASWQSVAISGAVAYGESALYFWLLNEFDGADNIYWPIWVVGFLAILFTPW